MFPFDTGTFMGNRYDGFIHRGMKLESYELDHIMESILSYISVMFHDNENYINVMCKPVFQRRNGSTGILNMLNARGIFDIDERANTVEIISNENVYLLDSIECIILP